MCLLIYINIPENFRYSNTKNLIFGGSLTLKLYAEKFMKASSAFDYNINEVILHNNITTNEINIKEQIKCDYIVKEINYAPGNPH